MKVFLTGGTGFVGFHVAELLVDEGCQITAMVRETSDTAHLEQLGVELVVGELEAPERIADSLVDVDAVVHIAGLTGAPDAAVLYRVNAEGTRRLVDCAARVCNEGAQFVYISSVSAQGPASGDEPPDANRRPRPVSHYGRSKLEGEGAVLAHRDRLDVTILRPPVIYGPRDWDMFEVFQLADRGLAPVIGGRERWLSVVHGEDVATAVSACLRADECGGVYPIDDGHCYTWTELAEHISRAVETEAISIPLPKPAFAAAAAVAEVGGGLLGMTATFNLDKYREMVQPSWVCGHEAIARDLDWEPKWDLAEGARQTAQWYRAQGWL